MAENRPMASLDGARILHLSADFPDPLVPGKTRAVARLLDLVAEADHRVYSLNRVGGAPGIAALPFGPAVPGPPGRHVTDRAHRALAYAAPPYGLWLKTRMTAVAGAISADLAARGWRPDIVHAHKLSVEGLAGWALARRFAAPLIVSSQGNSDLKILGAKATLRPAWRRIWQSADWILPFAPWTAAALDERLGPRTRPMTILPCPTPADGVLPPRWTGPVVRTAFRLDEHANKGAAVLIEAARLAARAVPGLTLEIAGAGSPGAFARLERMARATGGITRLVGPVPHDEMPEFWNGAACLVLPSRRESYGMVFAEALLAGCPVIHGAGSGIDGYFPGAPFVRSADPGDAVALARQIAGMVRGAPVIKAALAAAQRDGALARLQRPAIAAVYRAALAGVLGAARPAPTRARAA